jgi:protein-disulfide isomerase
MRHIARIVMICLFLALALNYGRSQEPGRKTTSPQDEKTVRQEIDALKEGQQQILKELQEIRKILQAMQESAASSETPKPPASVALNPSGENFRGDKNARLAIIEYSDFQCPYCGEFVRETFPKIESTYIKTGKIRYYFRDLPLSIHANAVPAANAARCAGEQGKFWEMHDRLFANQSALDAADLSKYARQLELDPGKFKQCLSSGKYTEGIRESIAGAEKIGIDGTPAFLVGVIQPEDGQMKVVKMFVGEEPFESFKSALDSLLASDPK